MSSEDRSEADQLARMRERVMTEVSQQTDVPTRHPRRVLSFAIVGGALGLVAFGGGAAAVSRTIWREDNGAVAIDGSQLRPVYHGRYLTLAEVKRLQRQGRVISANNAELACQGISLYFDTEAERDAYLDDFDRRYGDIPGIVPAGEDVCAPYAAAPRYVTQP